MGAGEPGFRGSRGSVTLLPAAEEAPGGPLLNQEGVRGRSARRGDAFYNRLARLRLLRRNASAISPIGNAITINPKTATIVSGPSPKTSSTLCLIQLSSVGSR